MPQRSSGIKSEPNPIRCGNTNVPRLFKDKYLLETSNRWALFNGQYCSHSGKMLLNKFFPRCFSLWTFCHSLMRLIILSIKHVYCRLNALCTFVTLTSRGQSKPLSQTVSCGLSWDCEPGASALTACIFCLVLLGEVKKKKKNVRFSTRLFLYLNCVKQAHCKLLKLVHILLTCFISFVFFLCVIVWCKCLQLF